MVVLFSGCAGALLSRIGGEKQLPKDIPQDLQTKFEVMENGAVPSPTPSPQVKPVAQSVGLDSVNKRKRPVVGRGKKDRRPTSPHQEISSSAPALTDTAHFQFPVRRPERDSIWIAEKQVYDVSYFGVSAGDFTVRVEPFKWVGGRKVYHVRGTAISSKVFSLFYRLNDEVETYIDYDGIFSHRFHILLNESKQSRDALELNDSEKGQTFYWNRWQRKDQPYIESKEYFPIQPFSQDSLSALYFLRSVPLPEGGIITFPVINEGKTWDADVTVVRRETLNTVIGRVRTVVLRPEPKYQGILKKQGDNYLWLTDDDRRILVRLEAKVKIGTVVAELKSMEPGNAPEPAAKGMAEANPKTVISSESQIPAAR